MQGPGAWHRHTHLILYGVFVVGLAFLKVCQAYFIAGRSVSVEYETLRMDSYPYSSASGQLVYWSHLGSHIIYVGILSKSLPITSHQSAQSAKSAKLPSHCQDSAETPRQLPRPSSNELCEPN